MKHVFATGQLLLTASLFFLYSCQKNEAVLENQAPQSEMAAKATAWLDGRLAKANTTDKQARIKAIKDNLLLANLWTEELSDGELFILVPLKQGLDSKHNNEKQKSSTLSLILTKAGTIRKSQIIQYVPATGSDMLPHGAINSIFNFKRLKEDATFTFLSLSDYKVDEYLYSNGSLNSYGTVRIGNDRSGYSLRQTSDQCPEGQQQTNWYWVSTDENGNENWEYLYYTCDGCLPHLDFDPGGGGGGGEAEVPDAEVDVSRQLEWEVNRADNNSWIVTSTEKFSGRKGSQNNKRFTDILHMRSGRVSYHLLLDAYRVQQGAIGK